MTKGTKEYVVVYEGAWSQRALSLLLFMACSSIQHLSLLLFMACSSIQHLSLLLFMACSSIQHMICASKLGTYM